MAEFTGDFVQALLRPAQILGHQFPGPRRLAYHRRAGHLLIGAKQRIDVAAPRHEWSGRPD